ncbi:carbohydrate ABC transporter permease [Paenibacillus sp. Soil522]|uniref:carbohydrate ABC transporter permease n=1 Tax=Paenibacillus sp. Soil522 TaxID=1736388 RepID=UPI0006F2C1BF|nr:sugar ABC transporter permease [Paenibacillus sp. Soil522]KRE46896.1 ABC transporter permease [Paenibacillus sp. Soil522]HTG70164.1 sugar ABC transporter permease [Candidatus Udaeobacter sp.]
MKKSITQTIGRHKESYLLMTPYMIFFLLFTILPVVLSIVLGFTYYNMIEPPRFIGWYNYIRLFLDDDIFIIAVKNTLFFAFVTGPVSYVLSFLVAWMINDLSKTLRSIATTVFYIPTIIGISVFPMWRLIFSPDAYGYLNGMLMGLGIISDPIAWLLDKEYILLILIVVQLWMSLGISFLAFVAGLQTVDRSLYEAGVVDGIKNRFQELWYITLPSMIPQLIFGAVMQIVISFSVADVSIQLAGFPSTEYAGETMVTHIMDYGSIRYEMGYASAMAVVLFFMMVFTNRLVTKILQKVGI